MKLLQWSQPLVVASLAIAGLASAARYLERPINGVIAWGIGGGTDSVSRLVTLTGEMILGKSAILSNKIGATGAIAAQAVST